MSNVRGLLHESVSWKDISFTQHLVMLCRPFFLPCLLAALISAVALISNAFMLTETLPRIVQARAADHAANQKDETAPLLAAENGQSGSDIGGELRLLLHQKMLQEWVHVLSDLLLCSLTGKWLMQQQLYHSMHGVSRHHRSKVLPSCIALHRCKCGSR